MLVTSQYITHTEEKKSSDIKSFVRNETGISFACLAKKMQNKKHKIYLLNNYTSSIIAKDFGSQAGEKVKKAIENIAATIIQRYYRKVFARNAYNHMFTEGEHYKSQSTQLTKYQHFKKYCRKNKNKQFNSLKDMQTFSTLCLQEIKDKLGYLNEKEQNFINKINSFSNMVLMHRTHDDFSKDKIVIYSNKLIQLHKIEISYSHTTCYDIDTLGNNDFVFTTPYFSSGNDEETIKQIINSGILKLTFDYGENAYFFKNKAYYNGYLTLTDHKVNTVKKYAELYPGEEIYEHIQRIIAGFESTDDTDVPMFLQEDMQLGIAYHTIYFLRQLIKHENCRFFCEKALRINQPENFNSIMHTIFNPEFHVPKMLAIKEPKPGINIVNTWFHWS